MFDLFSWSHILILLTVALVVVGPKDLPKMMHMAGKWAGKARALANEFKKSFDDMARQSELDELRKEVENLRNHSVITDTEAELNKPLESGAVENAPHPIPELDIGPEPRTGELQVTDSVSDNIAGSAPPLMTAGEPHT
jgi:sec-independent protein translocase protein TatB